jgi:glycine hydroxymethyltransferase
MSAFFTDHLSATDPLIAAALADEARRQQTQIELIASENIVSRAVLDALGHQLTNKTLEGYPGNRFHGGGEFADIAEQAAIDRAKELFGAAYANVQPHSGSQANLAVFFALVKPGDKVLSLDLAAGGHLSHGARANLSGRWFEAYSYGVERQTGLIDYDAVERQAEAVRPIRARSIFHALPPSPQRSGRGCWSTWPISLGWWRPACIRRRFPMPTSSPAPPPRRYAARAAG